MKTGGSEFAFFYLLVVCAELRVGEHAATNSFIPFFASRPPHIFTTLQRNWRLSTEAQEPASDKLNQNEVTNRNN